MVFGMPAEGFRLVRLSQPGHLRFNRASWPGTLAGAAGLHTPEDWGAWSSGAVPPEVSCISKGKARRPYEFGMKVGIASTFTGNLIVGYCRNSLANLSATSG